MNFNIFATADNHLGKTLKMKRGLREIGFANFSQIPKKVEELKSDYLVLAGDVFDKENTDIQSYYLFAKMVKEVLKNERVRKIIIITGNHDPFNEYYQAAGISMSEVLESDKIVTVTKDDLFFYDEEMNVLFYLLPYKRELFLTNEVGGKIIIDKINEAIATILNNPTYKNAFKVMVSHFAIQEWMPFGTETVSIDELRAGGHFDLIILGDLHNETYTDCKEKPDILYTGSTMHTNITDLYNHKNTAKSIKVVDGSMDFDIVEFYTPPVLVVDEDNLKENLEKINDKTIIITNSLEIHTSLKDRVLHSDYRPLVKNSSNVLEELNNEEDMETLDVVSLAIKKIDEDETLDEETKKYLKFLINIDVKSNSKKDVADMVYAETMEGLK